MVITNCDRMNSSGDCERCESGFTLNQDQDECILETANLSGCHIAEDS